MKVRELLENINFHDSNVIELIHESNKVILKIDLCMWSQNGYQEKGDETKEVTMKFESIINYTWDSKKTEKDIDYDTILEMSYNDGIIKIVLQDDDISIITFKCNSVVFI